MAETTKPMILNVDDNDAGRYVKSRVLSRAGFEVYEAANGEEGLRMAAELKPQVALLDVRLPDISGIEVCRRIKADPATSSILVIQTSATFLDSRDRVRGLEGGADTYLTEPIEGDELVANVRAMLRLRQAEQAVREREAWLATTLRSIGDAVIATDLEGRVTLINSVAQTLVGWDEAEAKDRSLIEVFQAVNEQTRQPSENPVARVLREGAAADLADHIVLIARDGRETPIDAAAAPIKDEQGKVIGVVLTFRDVTERRQAEKERERLHAREQEARREAEAARRRAEEASRLKDEFLAVVSHELRTPLNQMLGWVTLLVDDRLQPEQARNALEIIERNVQTQKRLIEDLLDVSRINTGKLLIERQPVEIAKVVESAAESARPAAEAKGVKLQTSLDPTAGVVAGDADRLLQAVGNLLTNAIKFTSRGGHVRVRLERANFQTRIVVSDDGQGISPDFLPYVFDRFRQQDATLSRKHGGLGLGLAVVRHIVELHGGDVRAESAGEGLGATFTITLPVSAPRADAPKEAGAATADLPALDGVQVLLVDDNADARDLVTFILTRGGAEVKAAGSAAEAFSLLNEWRPDVILSDIGMPGMDGYDFIRNVRKLGADRGGDAPAVALTAYTRTRDRLRALSAGYQTHIVKPVEQAELITVVALLSGRVKERL